MKIQEKKKVGKKKTTDKNRKKKKKDKNRDKKKKTMREN